MDTLTGDEFERDIPLPPANFDIWPMTRIGAICIDVLILIVALCLWFLPRRVYRTDKICDSNGEVDRGIVSQCKFWGFWVCGLDSVHILDGQVTINRRRGRGCCSIRELTFPVSALVNMELKRRSYCSLGLLWAFLVGCLGGIWLHFIPCIWWTCDWGYYDGQGVRGAIWFVTWGILCFALVLFYPVVELELTVQLNSENPTAETKYLVAVGAGSARKVDDAVACYDLETLRKLANMT